MESGRTLNIWTCKQKTAERYAAAVSKQRFGWACFGLVALLLLVDPIAAREPVGYGIAHGALRRGPVVFYQPTTDRAIASQINRARLRGQHAERRLDVKLTLLETEHFLIFTDWPKNQHTWLRDISTRMYKRMVVQFQIAPGTDVWGGKCPIYVFWEIPTFLRFAEHVDHMQGAPSVSGYALTGTDGSVHMVMHRQKNLSDFAKVLVHEGSHAFLHRYISNRDIDPWLNEGLAEVMAAIMAPNNTIRADAMRVCRAYVKNKTSIASVFKNQTWRKRHINHYRIAYMLIESLIAKDSGALPSLIKDMKRGLSGEVSLRRNYKMDFAGFEEYFKRYVKGLDSTK